MAGGDDRDPVEGPVIPVGPIIFALSRGLRSGGASAKMDPRLANLLLRLFALLFVAPATGALMGASPPSPGRILFVLVLAASLPALTLRAVLIPLGLPRVAYWFAILSPPIAHSAEIRGGAVLAGVLALGRRRESDPGRVAWLDAKLARAITVRSLAITAAGLLAAARGKKETTRLLFHAVDGVSRRSPRIARRTARSWLVADAAQRGAWKEVAVLGRGGLSYIRWPYAMGAIARRLTRDVRAPSDRALWLAWIAAPFRLATLPLLRRALSVPRGTGTQNAQPIVALGRSSEALGDALQAHAACLREPTESTLLAAGRAWGNVGYGSCALHFERAFNHRLLALRAKTHPQAALSSLLATAESDLAPLLDGVPAALLAKSETLEAAAGRARRRAMDEIESRAHAMAQRTARKTALHVSGEWMEWGALRRLCDRVARDAPDAVRRATFATVYAPACNYAVWLFNVRDEKLLANGIFRWLLEEARFASDAAALKVLEKNVKAGEGV
jgi:hypothetical protein